MRIKVGQLRRIIREAVVWTDPGYLALVDLAARAVADFEAGGSPEDIYAWLASETDMGGGRHRAPAVVQLVRKTDPYLAMKLTTVGRDATVREGRVPTAPCRVCGGTGSVAGEFCAACGGDGEEVDPAPDDRPGIGRGPLPQRM